jgi:cytoskeletal protein RodZ
VRKPVQQVGRLASSGRLTVPGRTRTGSSGQTGVLPPTEEGPTAPGNGGGPPPQDTEGLTPIRTYGRGRRRPIHLKIALITGLVAFAIAVAVLTLPELIFGGAISSHHNTTLFGGGGAGKSKTDKNKNQQDTTSTQPQQSKQQNGQTTPAPPQSGTKPPSTSGPSSTTPQKSPQQTTPQQTSPIPTTPTTPAP